MQVDIVAASLVQILETNPTEPASPAKWQEWEARWYDMA